MSTNIPPALSQQTFDPRTPPVLWREEPTGLHPASWDFRISRPEDGPSLALSDSVPDLGFMAIRDMGAVYDDFYSTFEFWVSAYPPTGMLKVQTLYGPNGPTELSNIYLFGDTPNPRSKWIEFFGGNDGYSLNIEEAVPLQTWVKVAYEYHFIGDKEFQAVQSMRWEVTGHVTPTISMVCAYYQPNKPDWMPGGIVRSSNGPVIGLTLKIRNVIISSNRLE